MININKTFYLRRLHSLCGLFALGAFLMEHILTNSMALGGPDLFNAAVGHLAAMPPEIMMPMEIGCIAIPFLFHGIYGIIIGRQASNNPDRYGTIKNWQFALQRWTAWFLIAFLLDHVTYFRFMVKASGIPMTYALLQHSIQNPFYFVLYLLGMLAAIFHFCNGITTFCMTWGIAKGPRIQRIVNMCSMALCAFLSLVVIATLCSYLIYPHLLQ